jgi:hypothetical protein
VEVPAADQHVQYYSGDGDRDYELALVTMRQFGN